MTVPWEQVATIQSEAPLNVVLSDGKTVQATLQSLAPAEFVTIRTADEQKAHEPPLHPPWSRLGSHPLHDGHRYYVRPLSAGT